MYAIVHQRRLPWEPLLVALAPAVFACLVAATFDSPLRVLGVGLGAALCVYLFLSERYARNLVILLLYLGLLDGLLRLSTGQSELTLVRDVLLWSMVAGAVVRLLVRRQAVTLPPLGIVVVAFVAVVLVQVVNPANGSLAHSFGGVRQHLQFVPLFFFGHLVLRTKERLRVFLVLLLAIGAVNGVVSAVQFTLTPEELAGWGQGYRERVLGTGDVSGRGFVDSRGIKRVRPFGLGSDMGAGGTFGLLGLAAGLGIAALAFRRGWALVATPLIGGSILAIVTSQGRTVLIGAVLAALAFIWLGMSARGRATAIGGLAVGMVATLLVVNVLTSRAEIGLFDRYESISPANVLQTSIDYREDDIGVLPQYLADHPLGAGLGSAGPAYSQPGRPEGPKLNAEGQLNFLVIELGIPGLLAYLALTLSTLWLVLTRSRRVRDGETRLMLVALAAPLFALFVMWLSGITSTSVPASPYFWFATGVVAFWLGDRRRIGVPGPERA